MVRVVHAAGLDLVYSFFPYVRVAFYPRLSSSKHHAVCTEKFGLI